MVLSFLYIMLTDRHAISQSCVVTYCMTNVYNMMKGTEATENPTQHFSDKAKDILLISNPRLFSKQSAYTIQPISTPYHSIS